MAQRQGKARRGRGRLSPAASSAVLVKGACSRTEGRGSPLATTARMRPEKKRRTAGSAFAQAAPRREGFVCPRRTPGSGRCHHGGEPYYTANFAESTFARPQLPHTTQVGRHFPSWFHQKGNHGKAPPARSYRQAIGTRKGGPLGCANSQGVSALISGRICQWKGSEQ